MLHFFTIILSSVATFILLWTSFMAGIKSSFDIFAQFFKWAWKTLYPIIKKPFVKPSKFYINR